MNNIMHRFILMTGLAGLLIGALIGISNDESAGVALLRVAALGVCFALAARYLTRLFMKAWLEHRIEMYAKQREEARKAAEKAAAEADKEKESFAASKKAAKAGAKK